MPVLADLTINGQPRKVVMFANRNGFFYTIDRITGKGDRRQAVRRDDLGEGDGCQRTARCCCPATLPDEDGNKTCPDLGGGTNFMSPSYDPTTRAVLRDRARDVRDCTYAYDQKFKPGEQYTGRRHDRGPRDQKNFGALRAIDPVTGTMKWEFRYTSACRHPAC